MQAIPHASMPQRTLFYWAHSYLQLDGLKAGEDYGLFRPAININIMRHVCFHHDIDNAHSVYKILEKNTHHCLTDDLEIHFLEVPKYRNKNIKDLSPLECWFAYFSNKLSNTEKEELAMIKPAIGSALDASKKYIMNDEEYWAYLNREAAILDYNTDHRVAREEALKAGVEEGHKNGLKDGALQKAKEIALNMLHNNEPMEKIANYTGLTQEQVNELANQP